MDTTRLMTLVLQSPAHRRIIQQLDERDASADASGCACGEACRVEDATDEANQLVDAGYDPIAATLFAFGRRPHAFTNAFRSMTGLLVFRAAFALDVDLDTSADALEAVLLSTRDCPSIDLAACWVATHLRFPPTSNGQLSEPSSYAATTLAH